jgi:cyclic lactone autoinducer peptide
MKKEKSINKKPIRILCNMLIALAPVILTETSCVLWWGEPECPDVLKDLYSR